MCIRDRSSSRPSRPSLPPTTCIVLPNVSESLAFLPEWRNQFVIEMQSVKPVKRTGPPQDRQIPFKSHNQKCSISGRNTGHKYKAVAILDTTRSTANTTKSRQSATHISSRIYMLSTYNWQIFLGDSSGCLQYCFRNTKSKYNLSNRRWTLDGPFRYTLALMFLSPYFAGSQHGNRHKLFVTISGMAYFIPRAHTGTCVSHTHRKEKVEWIWNQWS